LLQAPASPATLALDPQTIAVSIKLLRPEIAARPRIRPASKWTGLAMPRERLAAICPTPAPSQIKQAPKSLSRIKCHAEDLDYRNLNR
jgi:hypothetical protein